MGAGGISENELLQRAQATAQGAISERDAREGLTEDETARYLEYLSRFRSIKTACMSLRAFEMLKNEALFVAGAHFEPDESWLIDAAKRFKTGEIGEISREIEGIYAAFDKSSLPFREDDFEKSVAGWEIDEDTRGALSAI